MGDCDRIDHITISVANLSQAIRWYTTSFQCSLLDEDKTHAVLQFANVKLCLALPSIQPPHLAFPRSDAATLGELQARPDGVRSTYLADPSGNVVEVIEEQR